MRNYLILLAAGIGLLLLWWLADLRDQTAQNVWVVESAGEMSFKVETGQTILNGVGLCVDDMEAFAEGRTSVTLTGTIHILDSDRLVVWETGFTDLDVPILQVEKLDGLMEESVELMLGETYTLVFYDETLSEVTGITWSFYGEEHRMGNLYILICIGVLVLISFLYWRLVSLPSEYSERVPAVVSAVVICGISVMLITMSFFCLPDEVEDMKEAYALSNLILKSLDGTSSLSEEVPSGLVRLANSANTQSMTLFWANGNYGNTSLPWAEAFVSGASGTDLRSLIPALCLTVIRLLQLPYQFYLIIPRLANAIFFVGILLLGMRFCPGLRRFLTAFSLLPSTILLVNSFSRQVWEVSFCMIFVCLCVEISKLKRADSSRYIVYVACVVIAVIVAGIVLIPNLEANFGNAQTTDTMAEWIISYPWKVFLIYARTILQSGDLIIEAIVGAYGADGTSLLLTLGSAVAFLTVASGTVTRSAEAGRRAGKILLFGSLYIMTAALFVYADIEYLWNYYMVYGLRGSDFLPLLLAIPFALPQTQWASRHAAHAQILQPVLTVVCMLAWFGAALHGIG